jgi:branched-chain amino acid aminotransferase
MDISERSISVEEVVQAAREGNLKEMFGMGTAAVVSPINGLGYKDEDFAIPTPADGFAMKIKKGLTEIRKGQVEDKYGWMVDLF